MKTKKIYFAMALFIIANAVHAQLKIQNGGRVGIGTNDVSFSKCNINAPYNVMCLNLKNTAGDYQYISRAQLSNGLTRAWAVNFNGIDRFYVQGDGGMKAQSLWLTSDSTLKKNIVTIDDALNKILQLRGVYFNYKTEILGDSAIDSTVITADTKTYIGLIAQEVELIIPEAVLQGNDGIYGVAYQNLVGLLIEGIKLQQTQIISLQSQHDDLQSQLYLLNAQVNSCCGPPAMQMNNFDSTNNQQLMGKTGGVNSGKTNNMIPGAKLFQNNPNPFNENTNIEFDIPVGSNKAGLYIYNFQGQQLKTYLINSKGPGSISIRASDFAAGIYFYTLIVDGKEVDTKKMILTQ